MSFCDHFDNFIKQKTSDIQKKEHSLMVTDNKIDTRGYINQTELGQRFGVKVKEMGEMLKEANMRCKDGIPTEKMINSNIAVSITMNNGSNYWRWHEYKALEILIAAGFKLPTDIVREVIDALNEIQALHSAISIHTYPEKVWHLLEECCDEHIKKFSKKEFNNVLSNYDTVDILTRKIILSRITKIMD